MLHGYDYDPRHADDPAFDPFATIYSYPKRSRSAVSWLPLVNECNADGSQRQETGDRVCMGFTGSCPSMRMRAGVRTTNMPASIRRRFRQCARRFAACYRSRKRKADVLAHSLDAAVHKAVAALALMMA